MQVTHPHLVGDCGARARRTIRGRAARSNPPTGGSIMQDMPPLPELSIDDLIAALNVAVYHCCSGDRTTSPSVEGLGLRLLKPCRHRNCDSISLPDVNDSWSA